MNDLCHFFRQETVVVLIELNFHEPPHLHLLHDDEKPEILTGHFVIIFFPYFTLMIENYDARRVFPEFQ